MIMTTAGTGYFSSDRTIKEYAKDIWGIEPCKLPALKENTIINTPAIKISSFSPLRTNSPLTHFDME